MLILNMSFHRGISTKLEKNTLINKDIVYYVGLLMFLLLNLNIGRKSNSTHIRAKFSDFPPAINLEAKTFVSIQKFFLS